MKDKIAIFWFRRDLRLEDNAGLHQALQSGLPVLPIFIFDTDILDDLENKCDKRVDLIHQMLQDMQQQLEKWGSGLKVLHGKPLDCFIKIISQYDIQAVYTNSDYEPYAKKRDSEIALMLSEASVPFYAYKDQVIFEQNEIVKKDGTPYLVYTPYSKQWKAALTDEHLNTKDTEKYKQAFLQYTPASIPSLKTLGFERTGIAYEPPTLDTKVAKAYQRTRDVPSLPTTRLSLHLRFGTISVRRLVKEVMELNETLLNELIWREFFQTILWHMPHTVTESCKKEYDRIRWRNNEKEFEKWCNGTTGYPIVDAGMRELNETGFMHNRVRMITASFLVKHLLIDWRWGEAYFAEKLLDYDMASNVGNWQWAAGSGCDAAPYFRIFNPYTQAAKFDPQNVYISNWVPEAGTKGYPEPIVDHQHARERCLDTFKKALQKG
ncbi:MAG: deoxyribodipyrimidine photo-lyase [Sphingobacteriales bacterium]|nr:MAG: deoxyribodipyrimidine photo-lyase [Sphingobacteriales bacterium]